MRTDLIAQCVDLSIGSFTVHDGWAIHRAEANQSKKHRPAVNLVYYDANARIEPTPKLSIQFALFHQNLVDSALNSDPPLQ